MQTLAKLRRIFDRDTKIKLIIILVAIIIGALLETLALSIISPFIAILMDNTIIETNPYANMVYNLLGFSRVAPFLALLTFSLAAVYIFRGAYLYVLTKVQFRFLARRQVNLSDQLLRKILGYSYLYHTNKNLAELQRIVNSDAVSLFNMLSNLLLLISDLFMTIFIVIFLLLVSPDITLGVMMIALLFVFVYFKAFRHKIAIFGEKTRVATIAMGKAINQALGGIKEIKLLRREDHFHKAFQKNCDSFVVSTAQFNALNALPKLVIESACFGGAFIIVGAVILGGTDVAGLIPQLSVFVLAAFRILPAISRIVGNLNSILFGYASADAIYKSLFEEDVLTRPLMPLALPAGVRDIIVSDVTFQYPNTPSPVLEDISLVIPEKKSVAFVGASGAGKTTLADIILGIFTPESGGVFYDGKSIHHSPDEWSRCVGYIPQQIYLLDETIRENVAFGINADDIDEAKVWRALEQAQLKEFVQSLPEGLETVIGDRGVRLSGGQRQRIGIARAMYEDPPILVLDEATSSLDNDTEKAVMEALIGFHGSKTMLIVAHRLSTIEHCELVYRIGDKKIERIK